MKKKLIIYKDKNDLYQSINLNTLFIPGGIVLLQLLLVSPEVGKKK